MFQPRKGLENPIIRRAIDLCEEAGMKVVFHEDTVEVWFTPQNKRYYTIWSQFLADAEGVFGDKLHDTSASAAPARSGFGRRATDVLPGFAETQRAIADQQNTLELLRAENGKLKHEIKVLERAIRVVGMQRDEWKKELDAVRVELSESRADMARMLENRMNGSGGGGGGGDRYKQVRQVIVRRLHPDVPGTAEEKAYREKLFKTIWSEIEQLDKK